MHQVKHMSVTLEHGFFWSIFYWVCRYFQPTKYHKPQDDLGDSKSELWGI